MIESHQASTSFSTASKIIATGYCDGKYLEIKNDGCTLPLE